MTENLPRGPHNPGYPHIVVRFMAAVYKILPIDVHVGEPAVHIETKSAFVQHPQPYADAAGETMSDECKTLLLSGVLEAVQRTRFRMCVIWNPGYSTFVERDGSFNDSGEPPDGRSYIRDFVPADK